MGGCLTVDGSGPRGPVGASAATCLPAVCASARDGKAEVDLGATGARVGVVLAVVGAS